MNDDELVFRFIGYDDLSSKLDRIADMLGKVADFSQKVVDRLDFLAATMDLASHYIEKTADNSQKAADRLAELAAGMDVLIANSILTRTAIESLADKMDKLSDAENRTAVAAGGAGIAIGAMGLITFITANPIVSLVIAVLALGAAFSSIMPIVGVWLASLIPMAAALIAVGASGFLAFGAIGVLTAGVILLANAFFNAGKAVDPLLKIETALKNMALVLESKAYPIAIKILNWAMQFIPAIQNLGLQILSWFGQRLPTILLRMSDVVNDLFEAFDRIGPVFGRLFDHMMQSPAVGQIFDATIDFIVNTIIGLLTNLQRMESWFESRFLPLGAIVGAGFNQIGNFIQWGADQFAKFIDWLIAAWPSAVNYTRTVIGELRRDWALAVQGFQWASIILRPIIALMGLLGEGIRALAPHLGQARFAFLALGAVAAVAVAIILLFAASAMFSVLAIFALIAAIIALVHWVHDKAIPAIGQFMSAVGTFVNNALNAFSSFFNSIINFAETSWHQFTESPAYWFGVLFGLLLGLEIKIIGIISTWLLNLLMLVGRGWNMIVNAAIRELGQLPGQVFSLGVRVLDFLTRALESGTPITLAAVGHIILAIGNEFNKLPGQMFQIGQDIVRGIARGLSSLNSWIVSQAQSMAQGILDGIRTTLGIGSPSIVMAMQVGLPMAQGIALGMQLGIQQHVLPVQNTLTSPMRSFAPININQNQQQGIILKIDNEILAKAIVNSISKWRDRAELI